MNTFSPIKKYPQFSSSIRSPRESRQYREGGEYGSALKTFAGETFFGGFYDKDKDGIDDRFQEGPGKPYQQQREKGWFTSPGFKSGPGAKENAREAAERIRREREGKPIGFKPSILSASFSGMME